MSKPERGSLSMLKRALPNLAPATAPAELEAKVLATSGSETERHTAEGHPDDVQQMAEVHQNAGESLAQSPSVEHPVAAGGLGPATRLVPRPGRRKEPVQMVTYRIPASLYDQLMRTAEYNNLNMTDIVVEAIERHLPNFPTPDR